MLTVCTSSTDADYATCGDVMELLFNSTATAAVATTQEINRIGRLVSRASAWAESYVGRPLALQVYSESLPAYGTRTLMLSRRPVVKVLRLFDSTATSDATELTSTEYRILDRDAGLLDQDGVWAWTADRVSAETPFNLGLSPTYRPGSVARPWLAEYIAGYSVVGSTTTSFGVSSGAEEYTTGPTLPPDVTQAVAVRAAELYGNPLGVTSRRVGDLAVTYGQGADGGVRSAAEALLRPYRSAI